MIADAQFLERHYAAHANFKKSSTQWADLPHASTEYFCIKMQGNPRGTNTDNAFSLKAVAFDKAAEPRVMVYNSDGTSLICDGSTSACLEADYFRNPSRADANCRIYP